MDLSHSYSKMPEGLQTGTVHKFGNQGQVESYEKEVLKTAQNKLANG